TFPNWRPNPLFTFLDDTTLPADVNNAFWSTTIDPILYRGTIVRDEIRTKVTRLIFDTINKVTAAANGQAIDVSIIAHSLGTIVVHDVLQQVASGAAGGNDAFEASKFQFK